MLDFLPRIAQVRATVILAVIAFSILSCSSHDSNAAVREPIPRHETYALRPCSTCREVVFATEAECEAAAFAEAQRVGGTRTSGGAVYTCIKRFNVIATFYTPTAPARQATLNWTYTRAEGYGAAEGFRIFYGTSPTALVSTIQVDIQLRTYTITNLAPGTYYFAMKSFGGGNESEQTSVVSKVIL